MLPEGRGASRGCEQGGSHGAGLLPTAGARWCHPAFYFLTGDGTASEMPCSWGEASARRTEKLLFLSLFSSLLVKCSLRFQNERGAQVIGYSQLTERGRWAAVPNRSKGILRRVTSPPHAREGGGSLGTPHHEEAGWRGEGTGQGLQGWPGARQGGQGFSPGGTRGRQHSRPQGREGFWGALVPSALCQRCPHLALELKTNPKQFCSQWLKTKAVGGGE